MVLDGEVEIDGKYVGGHIRPENKAEDRIDRRLKKFQNMKRLSALALRERGLGRSGQTFTRIIRDEDGDAAWAAVRDHVSRKATVIADRSRWRAGSCAAAMGHADTAGPRQRQD